MSDILKGIFIALIPALLVSIVTAIITVKLSVRQFRSQRWWERKADTYSRIIEYLSSLQYCYGEWIKEEMTGYKEGKIRMQKISETYNIALEGFIKECNASAYIISEKAHMELEKLRKEVEWEERTIDWFEDIETRYDMVKSTIGELRGHAKADLDLQ